MLGLSGSLLGSFQDLVCGCEATEKPAKTVNSELLLFHLKDLFILFMCTSVYMSVCLCLCVYQGVQKRMWGTPGAGVIGRYGQEL